MTQKSLTRSLMLTALLACGPSPAADDPLAPLAFLAGHCWTTTFADGRHVDTHCYEWMHDGKQLRDRHIVAGDDPAYRGETIYAWHGGRRRIEYRYWNSLGGQSDGYVEAGAEGTLRFLDDRYVGPDGVEYKFASEMTRPGETQYRITVRSLDGDTWRDIYTRVFERTEAQAAQ